MPAKVITAVRLERDSRDCTQIAVHLDGDAVFLGEGLMWGLAASLGQDVGTWTGQTVHVDLSPESPPDDSYDATNF